MKSVSGKDFAKVLEQNGWVLLRIQGSHHNLWKTWNSRADIGSHSWQ